MHSGRGHVCVWLIFYLQVLDVGVLLRKAKQERNREMDECSPSESDWISFLACSLKVLSFEERLYSAVLVKRSI